MKPSCRECGSPLLERDTHCFRCGASVLGPEPPPPAETKAEVDLRTTVIFSGAVVGLLIVGAILMNWMGAGASNPLAATATPTTPAGWYEYLSPRGDFRLWLPSTWQVDSPGTPQWEEASGRISHPLPDSLKRISARNPAERLALVASGPVGEGGQPAELSVAVYPNSGDVSLGVLQADTWWAGERWIDTAGGTRISRRESGEAVLIADLIYPAGEGRYNQTVTLILKTDRDAYSVTVSALDSDFWLAEETVWTILDSFRPQSN